MKPLAVAGDPTWDSEQAGIKVRLRDNPGRQGLTTGRIRTAGTFLMVEVDFGPNEKQFKRYLQLEPVIEDVELIDLLSTGRFGSPTDLRRVLRGAKRVLSCFGGADLDRMCCRAEEPATHC
jgi:hypothetical protein